jgi:hypothetical protein
MFDPTIYDNLKVVFEGEAYDLDAQGEFLVTLREDMVNLADMSRCFTMAFGSEKGPCTAGFTLKSDIIDFAGELRKLRLADEQPGVSLELWIDMPGRYQSYVTNHAEEIWADYADHTRLQMERRTGYAYERAATVPTRESFRVTISYQGRLNESHIGQVGEVLAHFLSTVKKVESNA